MQVHSRDEFLDTVLKEVKFVWDHKSIKQELNDHLDEKVETLIGEGKNEDEALTFALDSMGDASEIGAELNLVHKPIWGWALFVSRVLLIVLVFMLGMQFAYPAVKGLVTNDNANTFYKNQLNSRELQYQSQKVNLKFDFGSYVYKVKSLEHADDGKLYFLVEAKGKNPFHLFKDRIAMELPIVLIDGKSSEVTHDFYYRSSGVYAVLLPGDSQELRIRFGSQEEAVSLIKEAS